MNSYSAEAEVGCKNAETRIFSEPTNIYSQSDLDATLRSYHFT